MATAAHSTSEPLAVRAWNDDGEADSKSERYLGRRLAAASADYKGVALTTFLLGAAVAALLWVAGGVVLEHWLVAGGLPRWARWTWLLVGLAALAAAAVRWIVPLVRYRVNLVYAARVIEREHPELHNDLVNTVLVKAHPEGNAATVVRSLERRAAKRLSAVPPDTVIDRTMAVRLAYALAVLVGLACVYSLAAPKSMFTTAARLLAPWARMAAPTRVGIEQPRLRWRMPGEAAAVAGVPADGGAPGDTRSITVDAGRATLVRGRQLVVSSVIHGLRRDERPTILVTPVLDAGATERSAVPWRAEMTRMGGESGSGLYASVLPDMSRGLDQSMTFEIQAGDGRSEPIGVALVDSPSLLVREVRYEFPAYMRRESETVAWQGDLRGIEGTRVVIMAESNQPLESAWIDFGCDGSRDLKLKIGASDLARATGTFVLMMNPERTAAEHPSYRLLFQPRGTALAGREQVQTEKLEHRIEVLADLAPEISIEEPRESPARVPPGSPVTVRVRALDPDFGLARVGIETRVEGGADQREIVLPGSERTGAFNGALQLVPERLGAGAGSKLEYRGVAVDTRPNPPNVAHTPWKVLQVDASAPPRRPEKQSPPSGERGQAGRDGGAGDDPKGGQGESGDDHAPGEHGQPTDDSQDGRGESATGDGQGDQQQGKSGGREPQGSGQRSEQNSEQKDSQQPGGQQGEPQPGQQNGAASGGKQGGKQPQSGADQQSGSSQGQGGEAGNTGASGQGGGAEGKGGAGRRLDGERTDGTQGQAGQQSGKPGSSRQPGGDQQGNGVAGKRGEGANSQEVQADGQRAGGQPPPRPAVAADGTNDGEAMERILQHRRQAGGGEAAGEKSKGADAGGSAGEGNAGEKPGNRQPGERREGGEKTGAEGQGQQGQGQQGQGQQGQGQQGQGQQGQGQQGQGDGAGGSEGEESPQQGGQPEAGPEGKGTAKAKGDPEQPERGKAGGAPSGQQAGAAPPQGAPASSPVGGGGWSEGAATPENRGPGDVATPPAREMEWGGQELENARNAADLAIEHLRNTVESGRTDVLDELGWTRDQARAFLERWEAMRRQAAGPDPQKRGEFERVLRSLGLRPAGVQSSRGVPADAKGGQAEGRRSRPPSDYRERFKAFLQGTSGEQATGDTRGASDTRGTGSQ